MPKKRRSPQHYLPSHTNDPQENLRLQEIASVALQRGFRTPIRLRRQLRNHPSYHDILKALKH